MNLLKKKKVKLSKSNILVVNYYYTYVYIIIIILCTKIYKLIIYVIYFTLFDVGRILVIDVEIIKIQFN